MVGGFSDSSILSQRIISEFKRITVICPTEAVNAIVKGAVIFGHNPNLISERISPLTYGISVNTAFNNKVHPAKLKVVYDGKEMCTDIFQPIVQIGHPIRVGKEIFKHTCLPTRAHDTEATIEIYESSSECPMYTIDKGVRRLGDLTVSIPDTSKGKTVLSKLRFHLERTQRDNGQPLGEKIADDIYVIYQYLEGANNASGLRQGMSKSKRTTTISDETDSKMSDILNKLSSKTTSTNNENTIVLSMFLEIKQMINDNMKPMNDKIDKLNKNFENETKILKNKLYEKDILITNLQSQIHESRDRIGKLQAEVKLQAQQIKDKDDNINDNEKQRQLNDKIISRLDVIDNKLKKQNATEKKINEK
ncbi:unnamed protein product [Mytilus edulis]|uniref:Uncharacterized protein n=1 Tax=Mytilus edulis TaxID=6550 RepID=A0A8S3UKC0_MYTED|nr:unnamed protein product [Mytilus edulis]